MRYLQTPAPMGRLTDEPFVTMQQAMDQLLTESMVSAPFRTMWSRTGNGTTACPLPLDVYATPEAVVVVAAAPGLQPDQLHVTFTQGTLLLSGAVQDVAHSDEAKDATWYAHEVWSGQFQRTVRLPFDVDADHAAATFADGIVTIVLPKAAHAQPKTIAITVGAASQPAIGAGSAASQ